MAIWSNILIQKLFFVAACYHSKNYINENTVIVCSNSKEVMQIYNILRSEGHPIVFCNDKLDSSKISKF